MIETLHPTASFDEVISELLAAIDGELSSKSRVVDGLLDLRNAAGQDAVRSRIDELLGGIPGLTAVPNTWWADRLEELRATG